MRTPTTYADTRMCARCLTVICSIVISSAALAAEVRFERTYGDRDNKGQGVIQTSDGGYVVAGVTVGGHPDFYLLKTDAAGEVVWETDFGHRGDGDDAASDVVELADGRLVVVGVSDRLDLGPISGGIYVVTTNASGELLWEGTFGGFSGHEVAIDRGGDLVVVGSNTSDGSRILGDPDWDIYLVKLSAGGEAIWTRNLNVTKRDVGVSIQVAADGGYYVLGTVRPSRGDDDVVLIKTDAEGKPEWQRTFGTTDRLDHGRSIRVTRDNHLIIAADGGNYDALGWDVQLTLTNALGEVRWSETFGRGKDFVSSVIETADGGFTFTGRGVAADGSWIGTLVNVDAGGKQVWEREFGGARDDDLSSLQQTVDGGFVLVGWSLSFTAPDNYDRQVYLIKTGPEGRLTEASFLRGDCNDDRTVEVSDALFTLGSLFLGDGDPGCDDACDSNDDGTVDLSDPVTTLGVLFLGNGVIPLPGMTDCGLDPLDDELGCLTFRQCP